MPLYNPATGAVTVDAQGFITVAGGGLPYKFIDEDLGDGRTRVHHIIKHPILGEITIAFTDVPNP